MEPVRATRYVTPLREGGSLPGLMEADDLGMYVVKFTGAGQGPRALVAEVICAELAAALGLRVPRWAAVEVPAELAPAEPDEEVQHLLRASAGAEPRDRLPARGAGRGADAGGRTPPGRAGSSGSTRWSTTWTGRGAIRTCCAGTGALHLIDHGAALTFHHAWAPGRDDQVRTFAARVLRRGRPRPARVHAGRGGRRCRGVGGRLVGSWCARRSRRCRTLDRGRTAALGWRGRRARGVIGSSCWPGLAARDVWVPALVEAVARGPARDDRGHRVPAAASSGPPDGSRSCGWGQMVGDGARQPGSPVGSTVRGPVMTAMAFEYAVLRIVPRVDRGEFVNGAVLLYCQQEEFLGVAVRADLGAVRALWPQSDVESIAAALASVRDVALGRPGCGRGRAGGPRSAVPLVDGSAQRGDPARSGAHGGDGRPGGRARPDRRPDARLTDAQDSRGPQFWGRPTPVLRQVAGTPNRRRVTSSCARLPGARTASRCPSATTASSARGRRPSPSRWRRPSSARRSSYRP